MNPRILLISAAGLLSAAGCAKLAGPAFERPSLPEKSSWSGPVSTNETATLRKDWWNEFNDAELSSLIERALGANFDLQVAAARVNRSEALAGVAASRRLPTIGASAGSTFGAARTDRGGQVSTESYDVGAGVAWELDIWGKLRKGQSAAEADLQATGADWRTAYLSLSAEVASQYFRLRQLDEALGLYDRYIAGSERILSIYEIRASENMVSADVALRQRAEVSRLRREQQDLQRERKTVENALAALLGLPAGELSITPAPLSGIRAPEVPAGLPSSLLERRPDILAAEYRVLAAYELAGQARLDRLPSISLAGSGGSASDSLGGLLSEWTLGIGPSINIPLFDPSKKAQVKVREADIEIAANQYRATVIRAFQETENTLINRASRADQLETAKLAVDDLRRVRDISQAKFDEGLVSQLEILETDRSLIQTEQSALEQQFRLLNDTVTLYKALGGGW